MRPEPYIIPKLVFREAFLLEASPSLHHLLYNCFSIFHPHHIHSSINKEGELYSHFASMILLKTYLLLLHDYTIILL